MTRTIQLTAAAVSLLAGCAMPDKGAPTAQASIPFVEFGNIENWHGDGEKGIYIQSTDRHWYYASFISPCLDLPFAQTIGFRTTPPLPMDKFDSVLVRGRPCFFQTFDKVPGPPSNNPPKPAAPPKG